MATELANRRGRGVDALAVFAFAWVWLNLRSKPPLHPDSSRDLAFARDLVDGAHLHLNGASASFAFLEQGTAWIDLLALCLRCGLGSVGIERVLTTLLAGSVAAAHLGIVRILAATGEDQHDRLVVRLSPLAGALVLLASLPAVCEMPALWQPLLLPVPIVFLHLALWRVLARGELIDALALALLSALAFDIHVVSLAVVVPAMAAVPLACRRPGLATVASVAVGVGYTLLSSSAAALSNVEVAQEHGWLIPGLGLCAAVLVAGWVLRSRFAGLSLRRRLELAVALEAGLVAVVVIASLLPSVPALAGRYLLPFVPGLALAAALVAARGGSRKRAQIVTGLAALSLAWSWSTVRPMNHRALPRDPTYTQGEIEAIARELDARGLSWTGLVGSLQGPSVEAVLGGLAALIDPGPVPAAPVESGLLLVALESDRGDALLDELGPPAGVVELPDATVLLIETRARLDRLGVSACTEAGECTLVTLAVNSRVTQSHPNAWVEGRLLVEWLHERSEGELTTSIWKYPVRPGPRTVLALPVLAPPHCAWQVVAVDGFELEGLPATVVELPADVAGTITVSRGLDSSNPLCTRDRLNFPPAPSELDPEWTGLLQMLTGRHGRARARPG